MLTKIVSITTVETTIIEQLGNRDQRALNYVCRWYVLVCGIVHETKPVVVRIWFSFVMVSFVGFCEKWRWYTDTAIRIVLVVH